MAEMVDLKLSPAEKKEQWGPDYSEHAPDYGYGLNLSLNSRHIEKLGIQSLDIDTVVELRARARVTELNAVTRNGVTTKTLQLQIEAMDVPNAPERTDGDVLYGARAD